MLKKITLYLILISGLAYGIRYILYKGIRHNQKGLYHKLDQLFLQKNEFNTIFIGSSRAECHFNPRIFDSITGLNSFNIGMSGSNNAFTYSLLKAYLYNSKAPANIIMNLDFHFSHESSDTIYNYPRYFPYLSNPVLYTELKKIDPRFFWFKNFPLYTFAHMGDKYLNYSLRGYFGWNGPYMQESYKGNEKVIPLNYKNIDSIPSTPYKGSILPENMAYLDSIVTLSRQLRAKIYFVISPTYYKGSNRISNLTEHINNFKQFAQQKNIPVFDYTNDSICYQKNLFADFYHMKGNGCDIFSGKFSGDFARLPLRHRGSLRLFKKGAQSSHL